MKTPSAALYVKGYDLLLWLAQWAKKLPIMARRLHGEALVANARELVEASSVALKHPALRDAQLIRAELALEGLRVGLRLAGDCGVLADPQRHFVMPQVECIGKMLGGFQKHERFRRRLKELAIDDSASATTGRQDFPGDREEGKVNNGSPGHPGGLLEQ